jgi:hypothetical protein
VNLASLANDMLNGCVGQDRGLHTMPFAGPWMERGALQRHREGKAPDCVHQALAPLPDALTSLWLGLGETWQA